MGELWKNTKQQNLRAWKPIMTFGSLSFLFLFIAAVYIPLGAVLIYFNYVINDIEILYSGGKCVISSDSSSSTSNCEFALNESYNSECFCEVKFNLPYQFMGKVYMYYVLTNFYQNHRKYLKSYDPKQLVGKQPDPYSCLPLLTDPETNLTYAPCGVIANSMFNDTFRLMYKPDYNESIEIPILRSGLAWSTDKEIRYKNPESWEGTIKPKNWNGPAMGLDPSHPDNNGYQNEAFIVWMHAAAFPTFKKFYGRIDHKSNELFSEGLPAGAYTLLISYNYPTSLFNGEKKVFLTTTSWLGSKNFFIGIGYILMGVISIVLVIFFKIISNFYANKLKELLDHLSVSTPYFYR